MSDSELLNVLDSLDLPEPCYVSEETKEALLAALSNSKSCSNNFAPNDVQCKYIYKLYYLSINTYC